MLRKASLLPCALASLLGVWAFVASAWLFPLYSDNNDEAVYLLMADTYRQGRIFSPAPQNWQSFLPWMSFRSGDSFITRYTPPFPATVAAASAAFGSERAALALVAIAAAGSAYLLARRVLQNRRAALLAAGLYCLSPIVLIQSTLFLSYLFTAALLQGFAALLIAGVRSGSRRQLAAAGLLVGVAGFARQFETLLFALPMLIWAFRSLGRQAGDLRGPALAFGAGALLPFAAMLAYFRAATGSPFASPFSVASPADRFGFGPRQMMPGFVVVRYTFENALLAMYRLGRLLGVWSFGGIVLAGLSLWAAVRLPPRHPARALGLILLLVPVGYLFFWGSYGSTLWGGPRRFGPYYYMTMVAPLAILGARGLLQLWERRRVAAVLAMVVMTALSTLALAGGIRENLRLSQWRRYQYGPLLTANLGRAIVFVPQLRGYLLHPYALARNPDLKAEVIWALDRGNEQNLKVLEEFPGRTPYLASTVPGLPPSRSYIVGLERMAVGRQQDPALAALPP